MATRIKSITKKKYRGKVYDLTVKDIHSYNIEGLSVHNSAVSSLALYALGVTKLDPIKYGLLFERFLNPERVSPPDIDIDFDYDRREEIYNYMVDKFGSDYCSQIITFNKLKAKAAIRFSIKAMDIGKDWEINKAAQKKSPGKKVEMTKNSLNLADHIAKEIPERPLDLTVKGAMKISNVFKDYMEHYPELLVIANGVEGCIHSDGKHPAGIVVCKDPVIEHIPLRIKDGVIISQYDKDEVEELGLLKFDLLALKTLTVIDRTVNMIKERYKRTIDIDALEPDDPKVFKSLMADTKGVFQFESEGMLQLLNRIKVDSFNDMIVANALYRPGPLGGGVPNMYADYKHGKVIPPVFHPKLPEILKETYNVICYQEDVMRVGVELAGLTGGQSDTLRKAMGKKNSKLLAQQGKIFIDGCVKNDVDKTVATKIWEDFIVPFGGYGFNKSHSAAYAFIAYQCGYLKLYYPMEFMCNLLTSEINNNDQDQKLNAYMRFASDKLKIEIQKCDINLSNTVFKIVKSDKGKDVILTPLTVLKGVGFKAVKSIADQQPFEGIDDFLASVDRRVVNVRVFKSLVERGCMDLAWKGTRNELIENYEEVKKRVDKEKKVSEKAKTEKAKIKENFSGSLFDVEFDYSGENVNI